MSERTTFDGHERLREIFEPLADVANAITDLTGRHGITRVSLTPDVGLVFGVAPGTSIDVMTPAGLVEVYAEWTLPPQIDPVHQQERATVASPATDVVIRGLEKLRNETRSPERAQRLDAAIERIQADEHELAKADRRTAEQERIITSYREAVVAKLRAALTEALGLYEEKPGAAEWSGCLCPSGRHLDDCHEPRIAELRKLTESVAPAPSEARSALRQHVAEMPFGWHKGKLLTHRGATDADLIAWLEKLQSLAEDTER